MYNTQENLARILVLYNTTSVVWSCILLYPIYTHAYKQTEKTYKIHRTHDKHPLYTPIMSPCLIFIGTYLHEMRATSSKDCLSLWPFKTLETWTTSCSQIWEHCRSSRSGELRLGPWFCPEPWGCRLHCWERLHGTVRRLGWKCKPNIFLLEIKVCEGWNTYDFQPRSKSRCSSRRRFYPFHWSGP